MRALAIVHMYPPVHNAGAEWMLHAMFRDWIGRGDEVFVCYPAAPRRPFVFDGVTVFRTPAGDLSSLAAEVDVVVTHLDNTGQAVRAARSAGRLLVHLLHNDRQAQFYNLRPGADAILVANSRWLAATLPRGYDVVVSRPHVELARYRTEPGELITLVNFTSAKGSGTLLALAQANPHRRFLAVRGSYGVPTKVPRGTRNVEVIANTPDIRDVYARTRVLLMPSQYESYGRVGIEAAASGIPTIATPTPGLLESLGDAGIFCGSPTREHKATAGPVRAWSQALKMLDDPHVYPMAAASARWRAEELEAETGAELACLHATVAARVEAKRYPPRPMPILNSVTLGAACPVCGARFCSCSASTVAGGLGVSVTDAPKTAGEPKAIYRTYAGDFRYSATAARLRGLIVDPDGDALPTAIVARIAGAHGDVEAATAAYAAAADPARQAFLDGVNMRAPRALAGVAAELIETLAGGAHRPRRATADGSSSPPAPPPPAAARVGDVLDYVGADPDRIRAALADEQAGRARPTLIAELERRLSIGADQ